VFPRIAAVVAAVPNTPPKLPPTRNAVLAEFVGTPETRFTTVESDDPVVAVTVKESVELFRSVLTPAASFGVTVNVEVSPDPTLAVVADKVKEVGAPATVQVTVVV
jgi:hypothetical protein